MTFSSSSSVPREESKAFNNPDLILSTRLVFSLNRETYQTCEVVGFILLLEQQGYVRNIVSNLISSPDSYIETVANEIDVCLHFMYQENSKFFVSDDNDKDNLFIPTIRLLTDGKLTLRLIHQNREAFFLRLRKNLGGICNRYFEDICVNVEKYRKMRQLASKREKVIEDTEKIRLNIPLEIPDIVSAEQESPNRLSVQQEILNRLSIKQESVESNKTISETEEAGNKEVVVAKDERTVFLTFSKGYPVSKEEVRVLFTKEFGEVIEAIHMANVEKNAQPLYAKMVLKSECVSKIEDIVGIGKKNRFIINGKHVVARKFICKKP